MPDGILAQISALKSAPAGALKARWRELFGTEPPPYNRRFLESRLAYRLQELAHGGLSADLHRRLKAAAGDLPAKGSKAGKRASGDRPVSGTRLIRDWKGVEHQVTVRDADFEYQGRPYKSLSAVARTITGTRWNGLVFFGLKAQRSPAR
ncbi:DUF2924 domain-containing protein [Bradyrhizobium sp. JYMT SZCCT0180]|uniref:DUF2924 domain-containing protein n=1 Tax=Bradyrhizobium sp. JYMT SZCCT0180 TaxID=2807666 RepID=UPI001BA69B4B|nr:DUF2924 domain-containing protein [Bradyrhizobium sp. JYMT SZCCT0180]MBR1216211.1 DUF2924 domain-containing protein [Bradyrhizobium sp. JYMT SZCCT0180]